MYTTVTDAYMTATDVYMTARAYNDTRWLRTLIANSTVLLHFDATSGTVIYIVSVDPFS